MRRIAFYFISHACLLLIAVMIDLYVVDIGNGCCDENVVVLEGQITSPGPDDYQVADDTGTIGLNFDNDGLAAVIPLNTKNSQVVLFPETGHGAIRSAPKT